MTSEQFAELQDQLEGISGYVQDVVSYQVQLQNLLTGIICFLGILAGILFVSILIQQVRT